MEIPQHVPSGHGKVPAYLVGAVVALFFAWGFSTVLIDSLVPKLKGLFQLNYTQALVTPFAFFLAYLVVSVPAGYLLSRLGYMRAIVTGLVIMTAGCLMFSPAASTGVYWGFLVALFVLASGITILQVAANPLIALLGDAKSSSSRLVLAQALNSFGTFIGPFVGASLILKNGVVVPDNVLKAAPDVLANYRLQEAHATQVPFLGIALLLVILAAIFFTLRRAPGIPDAEEDRGTQSSLALLGNKRLLFGTICIFIYVGAEVSIGSLMVNYLMQGKTLAATAVTAGQLVSLYWGGAMVGRFIGSLVLKVLRPGSALAACAIGAALLASASGLSQGMIAAIAIIAVGLCNSIMFPTIFALAIEGLGDDTPKASGLLCMAIFGGAVIPEITGALADRTNLSTALLVPVLCYVGIALYGFMTNGRLAVPPAA